MNRLKQLLIGALVLFAFCVPAFSQTAFNGSSVGGELNGMRNSKKQFHITTNTTINVAVASATIYEVAITTTNAGTAWTLSVTAVTAGNQGAIANFISGLTFATTQNPQIIGGGLPGFWMNGGINIVTAGTTPGAADVFITYK